MDQFEKNIKELIKEVDPQSIDLSRKIYDFAPLENDCINELPYYLCVGRLSNNSISFPALVPFISSKGIIYLYNITDQENAKLYIQNLLLDLINKLPTNLVDIILYDPVYLGEPFTNILKIGLVNVSTELLTDDLQLLNRLQKYTQHSKAFINNMLLHYSDFADYWINSDDKQKHCTIFVLNDSDFSKNQTIVEMLNRIIANTKNNNSFFILSELDYKRNNLLKINCESIIENQTFFYKELKIDLEYDKVKERIIKNLITIKSKQSKEAIKPEVFDIKEGIKIPVGLNFTSKKIHYFKLGDRTDNFHAIIGGQSGKGKSVLLNTIIRRGIEKYHQDDLQFMLFDCNGNEFSEYQNNLHVLVCESTRDMAVISEKLTRIELEFEKRIELLKQHEAKKIEDLYIKGIKLPRIVCIIDEFQFLFKPSDYKIAQFAEELLVTKIIKTGRKFGIHLIVSTQSLGDLVRSSILANIPLRIALGMDENQSATFLAYNNLAAFNLATGLAIYNNRNGERDANVIIQIDKVD